MFGFVQRLALKDFETWSMVVFFSPEISKIECFTEVSVLIK